jgi:formamidopyrimidine-DNA glycosylase
MQALAERLDDFVGRRILLGTELLGFSSLKTVVPAVESLEGHVLAGITRQGKYLVWDFGQGTRVVLHLSQAGRVDVEAAAKRTRPRGAVVRFVFAGDEAESDRGVLVREHGTQRKASWWVLGPDDEGPLAGLGPEPGSAAFAHYIRTSDSNRRLHTDLRDQRVVSGIGRGWGDDILQRARVSPFATLRSLSAEEREGLLEAATAVLDDALALERTRKGGLSEAKLGGRFAVHGRFGQPCPSCAEPLHRVSYESYEMTYCPACQTQGKILSDRRLSRLLK